MTSTPLRCALPRRALLRAAPAALALAAATALGGCGFQLRGAPDFAFQTLVLDMPDTDLALALRRQLIGTGRVQVISPGQPAAAQADVVLHSPGEQRERHVTSYNASGEAREFQLRIVMPFNLRTPGGRDLLPGAEISRQIDQSYSESAALSKEQEAQMLYQSLQNDLVQQIMRSLATVRL